MLQNYSLLRMLSASRTALLRNICMINHHHNVFDICLTFATCEVPRFWPGVCKRQCGWQCQRKMSQKSMKTQNYTPNICAKMCIISIYYLIYPLSCCRKNIHFKESNLNFKDLLRLWRSYRKCFIHKDSLWMHLNQKFNHSCFACNISVYSPLIWW